MTILQALQSASIRLIGRKPAGFFGASGTFEEELCDWANEVAQDIAQYQDWQALQKTFTISGTDTEYDLPADYSRMNINADVQDLQNWVWGYFAFTDINTFLFEEARGFTPWPGGWIIYGNKLRFSPAPSGGNATFPYISNSLVLDSGGNAKVAFTSDTDTFALPERLITLGVVWRWRENKGLASQGDQEAFVKALDEYGAKDRGSRILRFGRRGRIPNTSLAYTGIA